MSNQLDIPGSFMTVLYIFLMGVFVYSATENIPGTIAFLLFCNFLFHTLIHIAKNR